MPAVRFLLAKSNRKMEGPLQNRNETETTLPGPPDLPSM
jgi:hypothetical protein